MLDAVGGCPAALGGLHAVGGCPAAFGRLRLTPDADGGCPAPGCVAVGGEQPAWTGGGEGTGTVGHVAKGSCILHGHWASFLMVDNVDGRSLSIFSCNSRRLTQGDKTSLSSYKFITIRRLTTSTRLRTVCMVELEPRTT
jgi:hypothetical protein